AHAAARGGAERRAAVPRRSRAHSGGTLARGSPAHRLDRAAALELRLPGAGPQRRRLDALVLDPPPRRGQPGERLLLPHAGVRAASGRPAAGRAAGAAGRAGARGDRHRAVAGDQDRRTGVRAYVSPAYLNETFTLAR